METRDQNLCSGKEVKSMHHNFPIFRIFFDLVGEERTHAVVESNVTRVPSNNKSRVKRELPDKPRHRAWKRNCIYTHPH